MTSTAKNFAGQNLRGRSFKGQDLSGADFSSADLRGADFTNATLIGANFSKAKTGVQKRWLAFQLIISFLMSAFLGILAGFAGFWIPLFFNPNVIKTYTITPSIATIIILIILFFAIIRQGFTAAAFITVAVAVAVVFTVALSIAGAVAGAVAGGGALVVVIVVASAGAGILSVAGTLTVAGAVAGTGAVIVAGLLALSVAGLVALSVAEVAGLSATGGLAGGLGTVMLSIYVAWRTLKGDPKFDILLKFAVAFASIGGTSFRGADLRKADFTEVNLKSSDFRNARDKNTNLNQTLWKQAKKLDRSRLGTSILANPEVRELLVTGKPNQSKSYEGLNLRGANLDGVYLENVNFKRAILSEASFRNANLEWVNLTETQAIGTDFTSAQMTGVCLEGWSYDHTTKLDDVDCDFVFELDHAEPEKRGERRPHDKNKKFDKGDFTKRYTLSLDVVKVFIHNGINREAFQTAWKKLIEKYPDLTLDDIQSVRKLDPDVELTVAVPQNTDKGDFERTFDNNYESKLKELETKHRLELLESKLENKDSLIALQEQRISDLKDLFPILASSKSSNVTVTTTTTTETKAMAEQKPVTFTARDITNSVVNLGEIKGNVTNAINQIPNNEDSGDIKTLLTQLQEAISADKDLADEDKADALEQVENLAKIALHDKPEEKSTLASKAIRALKRIIDNIPTISKIVETVGKALGLA